ncbi:hypothetical protein RRG08_062819 [Elysia crispata]|uniref:Uncharacterized protein n=1 Tax=Elysia crispata TaxID=231223 RepID=A0AAE0Z7H6_9GAST|nr:hypothetical protein RRG08_062819 [Elysia crispata]
MISFSNPDDKDKQFTDFLRLGLAVSYVDTLLQAMVNSFEVLAMSLEYTALPYKLLNFKDGKFKEISEYCPIDLFSG